MSDADADRRQLMAKAVQELRDLRARVRELEATRDAPIAIVGMGIRFPGGANDPRSFWELLREGRDATADVPASRWEIDDYYDSDPDAPGKMSTRRGAFIGSVDTFDAAFFGISPREARSMDPQQRLFLEVAWEALENAAISPHDLFGRSVGVYLGICSSLHTCNLWDLTNLERIDAYHGTGSTFAVAAGRLSHFLGLTGPSLAIDTACSSSLVALHLACQSLRSGECELALVGGVNLLLGPQVSVSFAKARMLSPDGRSKAFAAGADGYGRGEGCGVIVLRRLADALQRRERVLAVVRGSAVNHDGHSSGLTVPNGPAQVHVVRDALRQARLSPEQVSYIEAHGTGTALGDPIEVNALGEVFGQGAPRARPLLLGSVKANIGHLEAAAGISGLIKVVLALEHATIPPHPIYGEPSRLIAWGELPFELPIAARPWLSTNGLRIAGVSSFGFSGTNAHIVVEEPPARPPRAAEASPSCERPLHLLALSARSEAALAALCTAYERHLGDCEGAPSDIAFTANVGRAHFAHRACVFGGSTAELRDDLERGLRTAKKSSTTPPAVAFLFTGQGSQRAGVGRALYETQPTFRACVDRCATIVDPLLSQPIRAVMFDPDSGDLLRQTQFTQPALFILEYALYELWRDWGVRPVAVLGHSIGEYVAACAAGVMSADDALRLVVLRGRLMQTLPAAGSGDPTKEPAMVAVFADAEVVGAEIAGIGGTIAIAAVNGPRNTVISGLASDVKKVAAAFSRKGIRVTALAVSHAFHSQLMDPILDAFSAEADRVVFHPPAIPLVSNLHGALSNGEILRGSYWARHLREPVLFGDGVRTLGELGCNAFVEIGPRPALISLAQQSLDGDGLTWISTLSGADEWRSLLDAVADIYLAGGTIDWHGFDKDYSRGRVILPTYPFERTSHPVPMPARRRSSSRSSSRTESADPSPWFYTTHWESAAVSKVASGTGRWLICGDRQGVAAALAEEIRRRGGSARVVPADEMRACSDAARVLEEMESTGAPSHIAHLGSLDAAAVRAPRSEAHRLALSLGCVSAMHLVQAVTKCGGSSGPVPRLAFVTSGGVAARGAPIDPAQAPLWGFVRSVGLEHPGLRATLVDLDPERPPRVVELLSSLLDAGDETQIALRREERLVLRLCPAEVPTAADPLRADATYLVTGGTGALGLLTARHLAARGARHLLLMARRTDGVAVDQMKRDLLALGVLCDVIAGDVANSDDVARVLETIRGGSRPLRGVFHVAGVSGACETVNMDRATLEGVLKPKWRGAWNLHEACAGEKLDHFVGYSSIAALWGSRGQAHYAAGNAFLDALAAHRRLRGEAGTSIQWGPWNTEGMGSVEAKRALAAIGVSAMPPDKALACFDRALRADGPSIAVADVDEQKVRAHFEARGPRPFFMHFAAKISAPSEALGPTPLTQKLAGLPPSERSGALIAFLRVEVQRILETDQPPELEQGFFEMGFDSLMAVELATRLEKALGRRVRGTAIFDHPRIHALAAHLLRDVLMEAPGAREEPAKVAIAPAAMRDQRRSADTNTPIAIIGMACRFPGGADTPAAFWDLLRDGRDATGIVPRDRWDVDAWYAEDGAAPGKMNVRRGGFLTDIAGFDARFFRIAPRVAAAMDPQHRLLLEVGWEALEDAALAPTELRQGSTGVYVGITSGEYGALLRQRGGARGFDGHCVTGTPLYSAAGRLSYTFGLQGPSMSVDTACSSSLTALHLACQSLRQGECKWALAGGVNLLLSPETTSALCRTGALSPEGRCKSFSAEANGYARGEGCGVLVLARLDHALAAGYRVRAIVRNSGVNHDGASSGFTVPNGCAQEDLIRRVWQEARVSPADVDYVEAHGTATPLGDPVEVRALAGVLGATRPVDRPLLIGSAKTNLGHCESAAGVAGIIKVVMSLEQEEIPPHLHCQNLSPHVPWEEVPVRVARERTAWRHGEKPRLSGVSSFGMGGTNAHVLLEEAPQRDEQARSAIPACQLLCVSGRSPTSLALAVRRLCEHLAQHRDLDFADIAYTTRIGRTHFAHRACIRADSTESALELLAALGKEGAGEEAHFARIRDPLPKLAFRFAELEMTGALMGRELYETSSAFRSAIDACAPMVARFIAKPLPDALWPIDGSSLGAASFQLAAFCTAYAQAEAWRAWGLAPQVVAGEGDSQYVAACFVNASLLGPMLHWIASGRSGAPPMPSLPASPTCEIVAPAALASDWQIVSVDVVRRAAGDWIQIDAELAKLYLAGFIIDWESVSRGVRNQRVGLPTYPFERRQYWVDDALADAPETNGTTPLSLARTETRGESTPRGPAPIPHGEVEPVAFHGDGTMEDVMVQQLEMVAQVLDEQLALLEQAR